jgi:hypothetical protein
MKRCTNWRWNRRKATSSGAAVISVAAQITDHSIALVGRGERLQAPRLGREADLVDRRLGAPTLGNPVKPNLRHPRPGASKSAGIMLP